jgi:MerR family transcriptional regulator, light-induced transcriptional regulator
MSRDTARLATGNPVESINPRTGFGPTTDNGGVAALFPIRVVSRLTGINPVTIRAWERRYRLVRPERTPGGHRLYSRADVETLRAASRLVEQGVSISRASRLLDQPAPRREAREDRLLERFRERLQALDDDGMSAVFEASLARGLPSEAAALLDQLPTLARSLTRLEQQFLEGWLEGLLAFRVYQRIARSGERRVLVCSPGDGPSRTWALVFALGLVGSGLRPALVSALSQDDIAEAVCRSGCAAVILGGTEGDWPGVVPEGLAVPVFLEAAGEGFLPLGDDLDDARRQVVEFLRIGPDPA